MDQRVSLITLAASDLERSATFYQAMGWRRVETPDGMVVFDLIGQVLGLYPREKLAEEFGGDAGRFGGGIVLSHNVPVKEDVAVLIDRARAAGADILTEPVDVFWGGHHGHFADPDGHVWEIAFNPFSTLGPNGEFRWNGYE
ncbi:VOC family protein [Pontivivens insulae]|uniref:VOC domain-containing protein n=1 Tax=Pontivivens insulae TaxID=1639689 RepID=A0A2R8AAJ1_9RHOB|nr:VOC family protein [Pontivivens insulae]RED13151.1 hypothetical protein DFR53_2286 [Pontivivens insulae]SPF29243.1 hypothetical protein POI8812_01550 [Pontivivens insulae]